MSRTFLATGLVAVLIFFAFAVASAAPDAASVKACADALPLCFAKCPTFHPDVYRQCHLDCINRYTQCIAGNPLPGGARAGDGPRPNPTDVPPKGQGLRQPIGVSGDKQVGERARPKGKGELDTVNVGSDKLLGGGKPQKPKVGVDKADATRVKPLETPGAGAQPIGKAKVDTGVSGIKQRNQGWGSQATSGSGAIQRSREGKKR